MKTNLRQKITKMLLFLLFFTFSSLQAENVVVTRVIEGKIKMQCNAMYVIKHEGGQTLPISGEYGTLMKKDSISIPIKFTIVTGFTLFCYEDFIEHESRDDKKIWIISEE